MCDLYGIALAALGMLATLSCGLTIDGFGPISDNAGGIADAWREKLWMFPTSFRTVSWFHTHTHIAGRYFDLNSWPKSCKELKSWRVERVLLVAESLFSPILNFPVLSENTFRPGDGLVQSRSAPPHRCVGCCGKHHSSHRKGLCHRLCSLGLFGLVALASDCRSDWRKFGKKLELSLWILQKISGGEVLISWIWEIWGFKGCGIVLGILFFFSFFFFFGWGWFWGCSGSFLGKPRGERQVRAGFSGHLGVVLGLSRLRSGETSGEMQVPSRFGHKKLLQKANCPVHFCFLYVFIYVDVCVCVCDRVCSMCFLSVVVLIFHSMHFFSCICNLSI